VLILQNVRQCLNVLGQGVDFVAGLGPVDQIEQTFVLFERELGLVLEQMVHQLLGLFVEKLVESMRFHQMRIGHGSYGAQVLLDVKDVATHFGYAVRAYLLEIAHRSNENARDHKAKS
jgi:hypothetical protein